MVHRGVYAGTNRKRASRPRSARSARFMDMGSLSIHSQLFLLHTCIPGQHDRPVDAGRDSMHVRI
jgi:hypothetical protein